MVTVIDKTNVIIPDCDVYIGESNNLVVDLADGVKPTRENPVIVTVTDQNGNAQKDVTVIALGDADFIEKGMTDVYGKLTLPTASDGYTDDDGKVNVEEINVIVNDELGVIPDAYVVYNEDDSISVTLPEGKTISHANRFTVTVLDSAGNPISGKPVSVTDLIETSYTGITDESGRLIVPPVTEDYTDSEGKGVANGYNVLITDETKPIENVFITIADSKLSVQLPEGVLIDIENRITATVTDSENKPVKDMSVTFTDSSEKSETNLTDENGKATGPPTNIDYTDVNGYCEVDGYIVTVVNETGAIENAFVTLSTTQSQPDEEGNTSEIESISVQLPAGIAVDDHDNRVTVTVLNKADNTPVPGMPVIITESAGQPVQPEETPDADEQEPSPTPSQDQEASPAPADEAEASETPESTAEPDSSEAPDQTEEAEPSLEPERPVSASGVTDKNGKVTVPPLNEDVTGDNGDGEPDTDETETSYTVTVSNKDETANGNADFSDIARNDWFAAYVGYLAGYDVIMGYEDGTFRPNAPVTRAEFVAMAVRCYDLFYELGSSAASPKYNDLSSSHWAYDDIAFATNEKWLNGYADGSFRPDINITRAEVVTVINRATDRTPDKEFINDNVSALNKFTDLKTNAHWAYYDIMESANDHMAVNSSGEESWVK